MALRACSVVLCASGLSNTQVASQLHVSRPTVAKWREPFRLHGLGGLQDELRPSAPRSITHEQVERVVRASLETLPKQGTHWTTRQMAKKMGLSQTAIVRIWHAFGLQPHWVDSFQLSSDPSLGAVISDCYRRHRHQEFLRLLRLIHESVPAEF